MQTCKWTGPAVLLLVLLSSCGRVHAKEYNFDNAFYNQQLLEQVDDVLQPWRHARTGGDGSGERPRYRYKICCGRYDEASLMREDQMREHCYSEVFREPDQSSTSNGHLQGWNKFSCNSTHNVKQKIQCVHMCLWQARGTFQENETGIEESKLRDYIRKSETQQWRTDLLDKAVTKCLMDYEKGRENSNENKSCSSIHLDLSYCLWEELQLNCPDQEWNSKSRYCSSVVSHLHSRRKNQ